MRISKIIAAALVAASVFSPVCDAKVSKQDAAKAAQSYQNGFNSFKSGAFKEAASSFMEASKTDPENPLYSLFAGDMLRKLKQYPSSNRYYLDSLEHIGKAKSKQRDKIKIKDLMGLSENYSDMGSMAESEEYARKIIKEFPNDYRGYLALGKMFSKKKEHYSEAITALEKSIDKDPEQLAAYLTLAKVYNKQNNISKVIDTYKKGCDYRPLDEALKMSLAQVYFGYKEPDGTTHYHEAIDTLKSLLDVNPNNAFALYYSGIAYTLLQDNSNADKMLARLTAVNANLSERLFKEMRAYRIKTQNNADVEINVRNAAEEEIIEASSGEKNISAIVDTQIKKMEETS